MVGKGSRTGAAALAALLVTLCSFGLGFALNSNSSTLASIIHGVQVANVTDSGVTIAWITDAAIPGSGSVVYGLSPSTAFKSVNESPPPSGARGDIHVVQLTNLTASTTYYFAVAAGGIQDNNGGQYYNARTGSVLTGQVNNRLVSGMVTLAGGHGPAPGVLVSLKILDNAGLNGTASATSATEAAVTDASGAWSIVLMPRTSDSSNVFNFTTNGSTDFIQYSVEAAALGDASIQTVSLVLDGNGHLAVPTVSLGASAATETPFPTSTVTVTPTVTWTPTLTPTWTPTFTFTPTSESSSAFIPEPVAPTDTPRVEIGPVFLSLSPSPSETSEVSFPGVPTVVDGPPPARPTAPPAAARVTVATPTVLVVSRPSEPTSAATQLADLGQPAAFVTPLFPFGGTPLALGITTNQTPSGPTETPVATPSALATPPRGVAAGVRGEADVADTLPPLAKTLFATGFLVVALGVTLVSIGVSRRWRNS